MNDVYSENKFCVVLLKIRNQCYRLGRLLELNAPHIILDQEMRKLMKLNSEYYELLIPYLLGLAERRKDEDKLGEKIEASKSKTD